MEQNQIFKMKKEKERERESFTRRAFYVFICAGMQNANIHHTVCELCERK